MKPELLSILQHSLGVDFHGRGRQYRNHFATGPKGDDFPLCRELVSLGFMADIGPRELCGGMHFFYVTDAGKSAMSAESPPPPKITRSQDRYRRFLNGSGGMTFREWLIVDGRERKRSELLP